MAPFVLYIASSVQTPLLNMGQFKNGSHHSNQFE